MKCKNKKIKRNEVGHAINYFVQTGKKIVVSIQSENLRAIEEYGTINVDLLHSSYDFFWIVLPTYMSESHSLV